MMRERGRGSSCSCKKRSREVTFHDILMELGPVGVARTERGGPDGGASSVRKKMPLDPSLQPTSLRANTSARYALSARSPVMLMLGKRLAPSIRDSFVRGSLSLTTYFAMTLLPSNGSIHVKLTESPVTLTA